MLVVVPTVFVLLADAVTPDRPIALQVVAGGGEVVRVALVSLAVTATVFEPEQPVAYVVAVLVIAVVYVLVGMVIAPLFGRVAGVLVAFLLPFLDLAIAQSPMLRSGSATWEPGFRGTGECAS